MSTQNTDQGIVFDSIKIVWHLPKKSMNGPEVKSKNLKPLTIEH